MAMHTLGRVQMAFWLPDILYQKFVAQPTNPIRCKMSVIAEASADVELICSTEASDMYPSVSNVISICAIMGVNNLCNERIYTILFILCRAKKV
jgi:hypothetical protein